MLRQKIHPVRRRSLRTILPPTIYELGEIQEISEYRRDGELGRWYIQGWSPSKVRNWSMFMPFRRHPGDQTYGRRFAPSLGHFAEKEPTIRWYHLRLVRPRDAFSVAPPRACFFGSPPEIIGDSWYQFHHVNKLRLHGQEISKATKDKCGYDPLRGL